MARPLLPQGADGRTPGEAAERSTGQTGGLPVLPAPGGILLGLPALATGRSSAGRSSGHAMGEVNAIMDNHITHLTAFAKAVAGGQSSLFEPVVISAYSAGADLADLLVAVEIAKTLSEVPPPILAQAYASIHAWRWIAARREGPRENGRPGR